MTRRLPQIVILLTFVAASGCLPEKRINWSHDGSRAAVASEKGLFFIDANGKVLPPRLPDVPARCAWFNDDQRLIVIHPAKASRWDDIASHLEPGRLELVKSHAADIRRRVLAYSGDWEKFDFDPAKQFSGGEATAILLYIRDKNAEGMKEKLGKKWDDIESAEAAIWQVQLFKWTSERLEPGEILYRSLDEIRQPKVSPDEKAVAFLMEGNVQNALALFILPVKSPAAARQVAPHVAFDFDWSPDSRSLAYIGTSASSTDDSVQLGALTTIAVMDDHGQLLSEFAQKTDRVGLLFNDMLQVHWLADGRLFFSSAQVSLPATTRQMPQNWSLFVLDLRTPAGVCRALGSELHDFQSPGIPHFQISPDRRRVLVLGSKGQWKIFDLASGDATPVSKSPAGDDDVRSLACWKNNEEVCLVVPIVPATTTAPEKPGRYEVAIWKDGQTRIISSAWPGEMREWLRSR